MLTSVELYLFFIREISDKSIKVIILFCDLQTYFFEVIFKGDRCEK